jgi:hypothetical protein
LGRRIVSKSEAFSILLTVRKGEFGAIATMLEGRHDKARTE